MEPSVRIIQTARIGILTFVVVVVMEHVLNAQLSPAHHMVSEYANAPFGWLMIAAFIAWAVSLGTTAIVARSVCPPLVVAVSLAVASAGILVTAVFPTQTSAGALPPGVRYTARGHLHDYGSAAAALALLLAVVATLIRGSAEVRRAAALSLLVALSAVALATGAPGIRQRVLVVLW